MKKWALYWLPPIVWMMIIFAFSSHHKIQVSEVYILNFLFFKSLHVIEYAILYFLLFRAFNSLTKSSFTKSDVFLFSFLLAILYAVSDEIHQTFIPSRDGRLRDVFIDTIGISLMYIYIRSNIKTLKNIL